MSNHTKTSKNNTIIPSGWVQDRFSSRVYFQEGPGILSSQFTEDGVPFLNIRCIIDGEIIRENCQYIDKKIAFGKYRHFLFDEHDLVVSSSGTLGRAAFIRKENLPLMLNTSVIRMRPIDSNLLDRIFLKYYIESREYQKSIVTLSTGSAQANYGPSHLNKIYFVIPCNIEEQSKIAKILSTVDEAIEKTDALIEKYKRIKQGLIQDLFRYGIDEHGQIRSEKTHKFKDSPLGRIPQEWDVVPLGKVIEKIVDNRGKTPPLSNEGYELLEVNSIDAKQKYPNYLNVTKFVSSDTYETWFRDGHPQKGDILIPTVGTIGISCIVDCQRGCIAQNVVAIRTNTMCEAQYMYYLTTTSIFTAQIFSVLMSAVQPSLKVPHILSFDILLPPKPEQIKIHETLSGIDEPVEKERIFSNKLRALKKGLMDDLLSGKVRVTQLMRN